ncbi:MAG: hypothetical protein ABII13_02555 [Patescibacteria group bacterium]
MKEVKPLPESNKHKHQIRYCEHCNTITCDGCGQVWTPEQKYLPEPASAAEYFINISEL